MSREGHIQGRRGTRGAQIAGEPVHRVGIVITPTPPTLHGSVDGVVVTPVFDSLRELFGLSERVRDALAWHRIFEVPGVAHQNPPRAGGLPKITVPLGQHADRTDTMPA